LALKLDYSRQLGQYTDRSMPLVMKNLAVQRVVAILRVFAEAV
jgi:hypothetical protein